MDTPKYPRALDPAVAQWADGLDEDAREFFEERAAIIEFDGRIPRRQAERAAREETQTYLARRAGPAMGSSEDPKDQR